MSVCISRVGKLILHTVKYYDKTYYSLIDILEQTKKMPQFPLMVQHPIKINCGIVFGHRTDGYNFVTSVFVDEDGLKALDDGKSGL